MNSNANTVKNITGLFRDSLNIEVPSPDTDLIEEGLLDSLMLVDLLMHLEQGYDITVSLDDLELDNFRSIEAIEQFIASCQTG